MATPEDYEPLLGSPSREDELEAARTPTPNSPRRFLDDSDDALLGLAEPRRAWAGVEDLDLFSARIYTYWEEKGLVVILTARLLNLLALAFAGFVSALLLLGVDYGAFRDPCLEQGTCSLWDTALIRHPLSSGTFTAWKALACLYLSAFAAFWGFALAHLVVETRALLEIRHFVRDYLGLTDATLRCTTWPEVAARIVGSQRNVRLNLTSDLTESDIAARIMRRDNYLIALLNRGVLALHPPLPWLRSRPILSKTLEWNLRRCLFDPLFDDHARIQTRVLLDDAALRRKFRIAAVVNAALAPFLLAFLLTYFFLKNAEECYSHPSSIAARRWSPLARWRLREFNELPCFLNHRLNAGHAAAERYVRQFPNHTLSHIARFVAFVAGSMVATMLVLTVINEHLLEQDFVAGRQTVWWLAVLGVILAAARPAIIEHSTASFDPGLAMLEVAAHTHHLPHHWRGRAHTSEVQAEFESLFRYRAVLFFEELISVVLTPIMLWGQLPECAAAALRFIEQNTVRVDGLGDVCSLTAFDLRRHGDARYGSPWDVGITERCRDGKLEKSLVSFAAAYPTWHPPPGGQELLAKISEDREIGDVQGSRSLLYGTGADISGASLLAQHPLLGLMSSQYPGLAKFYLMHRSGRDKNIDVFGHGGVRPQYERQVGAGANGFPVDSGLFASADMFPFASRLDVFRDPSERVAVGQALLFSYCEDKESAEGLPERHQDVSVGSRSALRHDGESVDERAGAKTAKPRRWSPRAARSLDHMSNELSMLSREASIADL